jgi:hypothetical protein
MAGFTKKRLNRVPSASAGAAAGLNLASEGKKDSKIII